MSLHDAELVRAFWGQWNADGWTRGAWTRGEVDLSLFDPEVVYEDNNLPDHIGETYRGHQGVVRAAERWTEPFEWIAVGVERIVDLGDELVSSHRWRARFRHTELEINERLVYRWRVRDGKIVYFRSLNGLEADEAERVADEAQGVE